MTWLSPSLIFAVGSQEPISAMPQAQLLMVAGFVMLGWVLARRQIRSRRRVHQDARTAEKAIREVRNHREPSLPLSDAPPETQRWQVAMFDLQRDLKADLDTRIAVVQTLLQQVDERVASLQSLTEVDRMDAADPSAPRVIERRRVHKLLRSGLSTEQIADAAGLSLRDVELTIATLPKKPRPATGK